MRQGRFKEKDACLRLKINMKDPNPCMRDPVAYRVKYASYKSGCIGNQNLYILKIDII